MKTFTQAVIGLCVLLIAVPLVWWGSGRIPLSITSEAVAAVPASSHVQVKTGGSLGSGTHIGDRFILTAAHVVGAAKVMSVAAGNGTTYEADVLWANTGLDVALLRLKEEAPMAVSPLSCAPNYVGQKVQAFGNPMGVEFVYTKGEVVGAARSHTPWQSVVPLDMTAIYGQSGGGVLDDYGNVVGVTVGLLATQYGIAAFGWMVPASAVCTLMARA